MAAHEPAVHEDYGDEYYDDDGPRIVPPTDARAAAILDGFRMCATFSATGASLPSPPPLRQRVRLLARLRAG